MHSVLGAVNPQSVFLTYARPRFQRFKILSHETQADERAALKQLVLDAEERKRSHDLLARQAILAENAKCESVLFGLLGKDPEQASRTCLKALKPEQIESCR